MLRDILCDYAIEYVVAKGHENILAKHKTTFEITKEDYLTPRGDCIIGISANKSLSEFSSKFKELAKSNDTIMIILLRTSRNYDIVLCHGSPALTFGSNKKIIVRRSTYVDDATLCIKANKAAIDLNRSLVEELKNRDTILEAIILALKLNKINSIYELVRSIIKNSFDTNNLPISQDV